MSTVSNSVDSVNSVNSYSAVLPPSLIVLCSKTNFASDWDFKALWCKKCLYGCWLEILIILQAKVFNKSTHIRNLKCMKHLKHLTCENKFKDRRILRKLTILHFCEGSHATDFFGVRNLSEIFGCR